MSGNEERRPPAKEAAINTNNQSTTVPRTPDAVNSPYAYPH